MAVDAQRRSAVADGRSIRSVLFRTMAESRDISACLHAIELLPRLFSIQGLSKLVFDQFQRFVYY